MADATTVFDSYNARLTQKGLTKRNAKLHRLTGYINRKLPDSLSFKPVLVNGVEQRLAVISSDHLDLKRIRTLPGEDIESGSIVEFANSFWIVTSKDEDNEVYTKANMQQCNYLLRWIEVIDTIPTVMEQWCYISDGTKYLTGETPTSYTDNRLTLGDTRIAMMISRNEHTLKFNRTNRFIIDDADFVSEHLLSYKLTKPFKLGGVFNGKGVMGFVLTEANTEEADNLELHIADYYKYFPKPTDGGDGDSNGGDDGDSNDGGGDDSSDPGGNPGGGGGSWL